MSSRRDPTDAWSRELEDLFNYNPPAIKKAGNPVNYRLPFAFFDRHLDSRLSLRHVVFVPSFTADIAQVIDRAVLAIKNEGGRLPVIDHEEEEKFLIPKDARNWGAYGNTLTDAISVAQFYTEVSFLYCAVVGSTLALSPHSRLWLSVFQSNKAGAEPDEGRSSITGRYYLEIERDRDTGEMHIPMGVWDCLDEEARMDITEVSARFRRLVTYQFYAATTQYDEFLENMDDIVGKDPIPPFPDSVSGFEKQEMPLTPVVDSSALPWRAREPQEDYRREGNKDLKFVEQTTIEPSPSNKRATQPEGVTVKKSTASVDDTTTFIKHVSAAVRFFTRLTTIGMDQICHG
ncbi:hypothetical protein AX14_006471 [Amanita brunnescens Koide BX004]|nr:hypothetical protein AX14_006471 [Amanita brunnescens Koide BX004]